MAITGEIKDNIDRGTLFGIYCFAEKALKIKWYFPIPAELGKVIPQNKDLVIKPFSYKSAPFYAMHLGLLSSALPLQLRHPYLRTGNSKTTPMPNHTQNSWPRLYGKEHPEYFGIRKDGSSSLSHGKHNAFLCLSNPAVLKQMIHNIEIFDETGNYYPWGARKNAPQNNYIIFGYTDSTKICCCKKCKALQNKFKKQHKNNDYLGEASDYIFAFVAKYAEAIKRKWPKRKLVVLAYRKYTRPPINISLPDNVEVMLCLTQPISVQNNNQAFKTQSDILEKWYNLLGKDKSRLTIWDYMCYPNRYLDVPIYYPGTLSRWHNFAKGKISGIFNNGMSHWRKRYNSKYPQQVIRTNMAVFMVWFYAKWMWNPNIDRDEMIKTFCDDLFGKASSYMQEFYKTLCDCWDGTHEYEFVNRNNLPAFTLKKFSKDNQTTPFALYVKHWKQCSPAAPPYTIDWEAFPDAKALRKIYPPPKIARLKSLIEKSIALSPSDSIYRKRLNWFYDDAFKVFLEKYSR